MKFKLVHPVFLMVLTILLGGSVLAGPHLTDVAQGGSVSLAAPNLGPQKTTRILVLASPHLGQQFPSDTKWEGLDAVREALAGYQADMVTAEALSGELVEWYEMSAPTYDQVLQAFATDTLTAGRAARRTSDFQRQRAANEANELLAGFRGKSAESISTGERRRAALLLGAAYDLPSAALQWSYLFADERYSDDDLSAEFVKVLDRFLSRRNEIVDLGIAMAKRSNIQRIYAVDDQSDARFQFDHGRELMTELSQTAEYAKLPESMLFKEIPQRIRTHAAEGTLFALFRWMNSPTYGNADVETQWHLFHRTRLVSGLDRRRAAMWEVRNLRIAANIRAAIA